MNRPYTVLDVFTQTPLQGNPLAVVLDASGLDGAAMQAIAKEFNLSETVFVLPPEELSDTARIRIFTPVYEMAFAGHPTIGTACLLALRGQGGGSLVLHENVGRVACEVTVVGDRMAHARFATPRLSEETGDPPEPAKIAAALGLRVADIGFGDYRPMRMSAGAEFMFVPVKGLEAIGRARPDTGQWRSAFGEAGPVGAYLYCPQTKEAGRHFHARMFAPLAGVPEDPATGSAAAALAGVLTAFGGGGDGERTYIIEQGFEMGRPSLIELTLTVSGGRLSAASIAGNAVIVAHGTLLV